MMLLQLIVEGMIRVNRRYRIQLVANGGNCFIEIMNIKDVTLIGYSDGGNIAYSVELTNKNSLKKLILIYCNFSPSGIKVYLTRKINFLRKILVLFIKWISWIRDTIWKINLMFNETGVKLDDFKELRFKTLIISASNELIIKEHLVSLHDNIGIFEFVTILDTNHFNVINSGYFIEVIDKFLET